MAKKSSSGRGVPLFGILLFFLGVVFLLQTLGIISWGLWRDLTRFWPVLIIIAGLYILLRHSHVWIATILILALLFGCVVFAYWYYGGKGGSRPFSQPVLDLKTAQVSMDFDHSGYNKA